MVAAEGIPNLNYDSQYGTQDKLVTRLIQLIRVNNKISVTKMSEATDVSVRKAPRHWISKMTYHTYISSGYSRYLKISKVKWLFRFKSWQGENRCCLMDTEKEI